jgi:putative transposase
LHRGLLTMARDFGLELEAWAVFSNHYHFVAHSPADAPDAANLSDMLSVLHVKTAGWVNKLDRTPGRQVWFNYWETRLTYQRSYLARLGTIGGVFEELDDGVVTFGDAVVGHKKVGNRV